MKPHKEKKDRQWSRLDNAAKIFPSTSGKRDTKVFRFACELVRPVEEAILQQALDRTLEEFPGFLCVLKHGLFWYYLEASDQRPVVHPENQPPCSALYKQNEYTLLFDVFVSTDKLQICMCSYRNNMVISFTSPFVSTDIQKNFFRTLTEMGIEAEIAMNPIDEE